LHSRSEKMGSTFRSADSDNALTPCQRQLTRHSRVGRHNFSTQKAGRWLAAECVHIFYKSAQLFKVLRELLRGDECALGATNLDKTAAHKILNSQTDSDATDPESRDEAVLRRQLVADLYISIGDVAGEDCFDAGVKKRVMRCRHNDIITSYGFTWTHTSRIFCLRVTRKPAA
jgi:hypothetical protein